MQLIPFFSSFLLLRLILPLFGTDEEKDKFVYSPHDSNATDCVTEILFYPGM